MLRVCLTLFNLQGARRFVVRRTNDILSQAQEFVKHFFQVFQNSFSLCCFRPCLSRQLAYTITPQRKSQPLIFSFFEIFPHFLSSGGSTSQKTLDLQGLFHIPAFLIQREKQGLREQSSFFANRIFEKKKETVFRLSLSCWRYLFFRPVSRQVSSA